MARKRYPEADEKEMAMRRVVVTLWVFSMMLFGASTVPAGQPYTWTDSGAFVNWVGSCGDFDVYEDFTYEAVGKAFFDKDGNWVRSKVHWTIEGVLFNGDAQDNFLPYKNVSYNEFSDPEGMHIAGLFALVTVPGEGAIFMDVGLIKFDSDFNILFEAGKHQYWNANVDALCGHLAAD